MIRLSLIVSFLALAALAAQAQTLLNPSFEDQGADEGSAASWNVWGSHLNRETGWTPTHSGSCLMGYHHWEVDNSQNSGIWQDIQGVKAGQKFTFSVWVWSDPVQNGSTAASVELRLEATQSNKQLTVASVNTSVKDIPAGEWHQLSVTGTTPVDSLRVLIIATPAANAPRAGALKFDDATLDCIAAVPATQTGTNSAAASGKSN